MIGIDFSNGSVTNLLVHILGLGPFLLVMEVTALDSILRQNLIDQGWRGYDWCRGLLLLPGDSEDDAWCTAELCLTVEEVREPEFRIVPLPPVRQTAQLIPAAIARKGIIYLDPWLDRAGDNLFLRARAKATVLGYTLPSTETSRERWLIADLVNDHPGSSDLHEAAGVVNVDGSDALAEAAVETLVQRLVACQMAIATKPDEQEGVENFSAMRISNQGIVNLFKLSSWLAFVDRD